MTVISCGAVISVEVGYIVHYHYYLILNQEEFGAGDEGSSSTLRYTGDGGGACVW